MAINNNIYFNSALVGFLSGALAGRSVPSSNAALQADAVAFATEVDSLIPFDALVSTGASNTQLAITTNTIAANEQHRGELLRSLCFAAMYGRFPISSAATDYLAVATGVVAAFNASLASLAIP